MNHDFMMYKIYLLFHTGTQVKLKWIQQSVINQAAISIDYSYNTNVIISCSPSLCYTTLIYKFDSDTFIIWQSVWHQENQIELGKCTIGHRLQGLSRFGHNDLTNGCKCFPFLSTNPLPVRVRLTYKSITILIPNCIHIKCGSCLNDKAKKSCKMRLSYFKC